MYLVHFSRVSCVYQDPGQLDYVDSVSGSDWNEIQEHWDHQDTALWPTRMATILETFGLRLVHTCTYTSTMYVSLYSILQYKCLVSTEYSLSFTFIQVLQCISQLEVAQLRGTAVMESRWGTSPTITWQQEKPMINFLHSQVYQPHWLCPLRRR